MTSGGRFAGALDSRARALRVDFPAAVIPQLERYFELLARWNRHVNLTALPVEALGPEAIDRLLLEPLSAARLFPAGPVAWLDLGSGGGSPAIPLKLARPDARLVMVESRVKKTIFLRECIRELGLASATAEATRFEALAADPTVGGKVDVVTVRAVRSDLVLIQVVLHVLAPAGRLLMFGSAGGRPLDTDGLVLAATEPLFAVGNAQVSIYGRE